MLPFRLVKSLGIMYVAAIQFMIAIGLNIIIDSAVKKFDKTEDDNIKIEYTYYNFIKHILVVVVIVCIFAIISYLARITIKDIPSPFDGMSGFQHMRLKELQDVGSLTAFLFLTSNYLDSKIRNIRDMFNKIII